jgi:hypothetical protein
MNVKITCPVPEKNLQAGIIYDLPDDEAQKLIDEEKAFEIAPADEEKPKKAKSKT